MTNIDQFESVFKSASKPVFRADSFGRGVFGSHAVAATRRAAESRFDLHVPQSPYAGRRASLQFGNLRRCAAADRQSKVVVGSHPVVEHTDLRGKWLDESDRHIEAFSAPETGGEVDEAHPVHVQGHRISMPVYIPGIDWGVIAIILGWSIFVDVTSRLGLFSWIAIRVTKASRGAPLLLLISYGLMTVVFSAVLNNVTAMIIVGSLTVVSLEKLGQRNKLLGFLLVEGLLTNVGGLLTLISSVPNIIVGTTAGISFVTFFIKSAPYVIVATLYVLLVLPWLPG